MTALHLSSYVMWRLNWIAADKQPYYAALDAADAAWKHGRLDVSVMEELMENLLAGQLLSVFTAAGGSTDQD